MITDNEMNSTLRGAIEEFNLCCNLYPGDVLFAECIRTFPTVSVDAQQWLHRLNVELERTAEMRVDVFVPATRKPNVRSPGSKAPMVDIYGFRDVDNTPFAFLSPFEFLQYWYAEPLLPPSWYHDSKPKTDWTEAGRLTVTKDEYKDGRLKLRGGEHYVVLEPIAPSEYFTFPTKNATLRHSWAICSGHATSLVVRLDIKTPR